VSDALDRLRRWEESGATWRVLVRTPESVEIALLTCDAGEEVDRLRTGDPAVLDHVAARDEPQ
jgi:siroheme synthase